MQEKEIIQLTKDELIRDWAGKEYITLDEIKAGTTGYEHLGKEFCFYMHPTQGLYFDFEVEGEIPNEDPKVEVIGI